LKESDPQQQDYSLRFRVGLIPERLGGKEQQMSEKPQETAGLWAVAHRIETVNNFPSREQRFPPIAITIIFS
jgi:hypothetical protein